MRATTFEQIRYQHPADRCAQRQDSAGACPDLRWPPAVRLLTLVGGSALAWAAVILLGSLLFG
jgi:hypothetical protein